MSRKSTSSTIAPLPTTIAELEALVAIKREETKKAAIAAAAQKRAVGQVLSGLFGPAAIVPVAPKMTAKQKNALLVQSVRDLAFRPVYGPLAPIVRVSPVFGPPAPKSPVRPVFGPSVPSAAIMTKCRLRAQMDRSAQAIATKARIAALTAELAKLAK